MGDLLRLVPGAVAGPLLCPVCLHGLLVLPVVDAGPLIVAAWAVLSAAGPASARFSSPYA